MHRDHTTHRRVCITAAVTGETATIRADITIAATIAVTTVDTDNEPSA
jgi:hypothetical protein